MKRSIRPAIPVALAALLAVGASASDAASQTSPGSGGSAESSSDGSEQADGDEDADEASKYPEDSAMYWAEKRNVRSIHERAFRKNARHEFTLYTGAIPNDEFQAYYPIGGRWNYYFQEDLAGELWGSYLIKQDTDLKGILENNFNRSLIVTVPESVTWMVGVDGLWSPLHGKLGVHQQYLGQFDLYVAFGAGVIGTEVRVPGGKSTNRVLPSGNLGLGMRFYLAERWSLRLDARQYVYAADEAAGGGVSHPLSITLGVSYWTEELD